MPAAGTLVEKEDVSVPVVEPEPGAGTVMVVTSQASIARVGPPARFAMSSLLRPMRTRLASFTITAGSVWSSKKVSTTTRTFGCMVMFQLFLPLTKVTVTGSITHGASWAAGGELQGCGYANPLARKSPWKALNVAPFV